MRTSLPPADDPHLDVDSFARAVRSGDEQAIEAELRRQGWRPPKPELPLEELRQALLAHVVVVGDHWLWQGSRSGRRGVGPTSGAGRRLPA